MKGIPLYLAQPSKAQSSKKGVWHFARAVATALLGLLCACSSATARADGPHIAFHGTEGAYTVTMFSAPDPLVTGPAELMLLVQNAGDNTLARVASASGQLVLQGHPSIPFTLTPGGAANRELLGATVQLPDAGTYVWTLQIAGGETAAGAGLGSGAKAGLKEARANFTGTLPVESNHGQRNTVLLSILFPGVLIALFLVNQYAKQKRWMRREAPPKARA